MTSEIGPSPSTGTVMYLNKTVEGTDSAGTSSTAPTSRARRAAGTHVTINGYIRTCSTNNEQFRFTIVGNQYSGEVKIEEHDLTRLTFNVQFQVRQAGERIGSRRTAWGGSRAAS